MKNERIGIRVSEADKKVWEEVSKELGISISRFLTVCANEQVRKLRRTRS
jgi:hypothetical protein